MDSSVEQEELRTVTLTAPAKVMVDIANEIDQNIDFSRTSCAAELTVLRDALNGIAYL